MNKSQPSTSSIDDERNECLVQIFNTQINLEISRRMEILSEIDTNIKLCKEILDRLRKEATIKFYMGPTFKENDAEQPNIHPAVKKLIGKSPAAKGQYDSFQNSNPWRCQRETRKRQHVHLSKPHSHEKITSKKSPRTTTVEEAAVKPCYIPPSIPGNPQENSTLRGNVRKVHMRVLVGNLAKELENTFAEYATHKWMVYIRSAPGSLAVDKQVSKVRFFLHPSYKPNDIVTVPSPPFTLHRRGWGEFPIKVQLYFKNEMNKSVDITHTLKLTGAKSGHHIRSGETSSDLWIYPYDEMSDKGNNDNEHILTLAGDMMKEHVSDFTSESRCRNCHLANCVCRPADDTVSNSVATTSQYDSDDRSESRCHNCHLANCVCRPADDTVSNSVATASQYNSDDRDSSQSDSSDSASDASFLGSIKIDPFKDFGIRPEELNDCLFSPESQSSCNINGDKDSQSLIDGRFNLAPKDQDNCSVNIEDNKQIITPEKHTGTPEREEEIKLLSLELAELINDRNDNLVFRNDLFDGFENSISDMNEINSRKELFTMESEISNIQKESMESENKDVKSHKTKTCLQLTPNEQVPNSTIQSDILNVRDTCVVDLMVSEDMSLKGLDNKPDLQLNTIKHELKSNFHQYSTCVSQLLTVAEEYFVESLGAENKSANDILTTPALQMNANTENPNCSDQFSLEPDMLKVIEEYVVDSLAAENKSANDILTTPVLEHPNTADPICSKQFTLESDVLDIKEPHILDSLRRKNESSKEYLTNKTDLKLIENNPEPGFKQEFELTDITIGNFSEIGASMGKNQCKNEFSEYKGENISENICTDSYSNSNSSANIKRSVHKSDSVISSPKSQSPIASKRIKLHESDTKNVIPESNTKLEEVQIPHFRDYDLEEIINIPEGYRNGEEIDKCDNRKAQLLSINSEHSYSISNKETDAVRMSTTSNDGLENQQKHPLIKYNINTIDQSDKPSVITKNVSFTKNITPPLTVGNGEININEHHTLLNLQSKKSLETSIIIGLDKSHIHNSSTKKKSPYSDLQANRKLKLNPTFPRSNLIKQNLSILKNNQLKNSSQSLLLKNINQEKNKLYDSQAKNGTGSLLKVNYNQKKLNTSQPKNILLVRSPKINQSTSQTGLTLLKPQMKAMKYQQQNTSLYQYVRETGNDNAQIKQNKDIKNNISLRNTIVNAKIKMQPPLKKSQPNVPSPLGPILMTKKLRHVAQSNPDNSVYYLKSTDSSSIKILSAIRKNVPVEKSKISEVKQRMLLTVPSHYVKSHIKTVNSQRVLKEVCKDQNSFKTVSNSMPFASLDDVRTVLRIPKTDKIELSTNYLPRDTGIKMLCEPIVSCNSIHSELNDKIPQELIFNMKTVVPGDRSLKETAENLQAEYFLEQVRLLINTCRFEDVELAVRWLIRGLPLVHSESNLVAFNMVHPYCASTLSAFSSWSKPKQASCEWLRAKTISRMQEALQMKGSPLTAVWPTKTVLQWSRHHGYSPTFDFIDSDTTADIDGHILEELEKKSSPSNVIEWMKSVNNTTQSNLNNRAEEDIDIINITPSSCKRYVFEEADPGLPVLCGKPWVTEAHTYVRRQVSQVGARLGLESLMPGELKVPAAATLMSHLAMIFTEDLLRRSLAATCQRGAGQIENRDVCMAVIQREEFDFLSKTIINLVVKES